MPAKFIDHELTLKTELRNFSLWHQGIPHYGFWAKEINDQISLWNI